jgi:hypothetical protein
MEETVCLLRQVEAVGVWGNHDVGLCFDPDEKIRRRYSAAVLGFMGGLQPRLEIDGCLFTHVEPWLDLVSGVGRRESAWHPPGARGRLAGVTGGGAMVPRTVTGERNVTALAEGAP